MWNTQFARSCGGSQPEGDTLLEIFRSTLAEQAVVVHPGKCQICSKFQQEIYNWAILSTYVHMYIYVHVLKDRAQQNIALI